MWEGQNRLKHFYSFSQNVLLHSSVQANTALCLESRTLCVCIFLHEVRPVFSILFPFDLLFGNFFSLTKSHRPTKEPFQHSSFYQLSATICKVEVEGTIEAVTCFPLCSTEAITMASRHQGFSFISIMLTRMKKIWENKIFKLRRSLWKCLICIIY